MPYPFNMQLAVSSLDENMVVRNGSLSIYDPEDTGGTTLLTLTTPGGVPLTNPLTTNEYGLVQPFIADLPQVMWRSGEFEGYFESYEGLRDQAVAAVAAVNAALFERGVKIGGTTGQYLTKMSDDDYDTAWQTPVVVIGPADPWPTGLPEGTLVVRTEA